MSAMIVGFCRDVIDDLPYEFASETKQLLLKIYNIKANLINLSLKKLDK